MSKAAVKSSRHSDETCPRSAEQCRLSAVELSDVSAVCHRQLKIAAAVFGRLYRAVSIGKVNLTLACIVLQLVLISVALL